jgi:hypothetical protein
LEWFTGFVMEDSNAIRQLAITAAEECLQGATLAIPLPTEKTEKEFPSGGNSIDEEKAIPVLISKLDDISYNADINIVDWGWPR